MNMNQGWFDQYILGLRQKDSVSGIWKDLVAGLNFPMFPVAMKSSPSTSCISGAQQKAGPFDTDQVMDAGNSDSL
jgi:hypothetical protein